jgi:hypothetical protein
MPLLHIGTYIPIFSLLGTQSFELVFFNIARASDIEIKILFFTVSKHVET